jgi:ATP-binding cassette subfamily B protein
VLLYGGRQAIRLEITPGDFVAFISYLGLLTWPMMALGWVANLIQRGRASLERVQAILASVPEVRDAPGAGELPSPRGEVAFETVSFRYPGAAAAALEGIDLAVPAGKVLGIVGPPGSGKTTLLSLLPRLYDPTAGAIRLDGHDTRTLRLEALRSAIACMPQEPFLFSGTIRDNIALGRPAASAEMLERAARDAALLDTIRAFPDGFDTVVGERGVMLSGGQKQRVALARCLLADAPVLVLDDPVSQVDFDTAARIIRTLGGLAGSKTILIASHRLAALRFADRIVVLEAGRIVAGGTHAELLRASPYYARAHRLQEIEETTHAA